MRLWFDLFGFGCEEAYDGCIRCSWTPSRTPPKILNPFAFSQARKHEAFLRGLGFGVEGFRV